MTTRKSVPDPFKYGARDIVTTVVQVGAAVAGVAIAITQGDYYALFGLAGLAGGAKGDLLVDLLKVLSKQKAVPVIVLAMLLLMPGCGTTITPAFLAESKQAIQALGGDYLTGCQEVTIAPAFTVNWESDDIGYAGGVFAGCAENGKLAEFRCLLVVEEGKVAKIVCEPGRLWLRQVEVPPSSANEAPALPVLVPAPVPVVATPHP